MQVQGFILPINKFSGDMNTQLEPIWFQTNPTISDGKSAEFDSVSIQGRAEPVQVYRSSGARTISLDLTYQAYSKEHDERWVAQQIARMRALVYPIYRRDRLSSGAFLPPPLVLLNYGTRFVNLPCIVTNYSISYSEDDVIDIENSLPQTTKIQLGLTVSYPYASVPGHDDVARMYGGGTFGGLEDTGNVSGYDFQGTVYEAVALPSYIAPPVFNIYNRNESRTRNTSAAYDMAESQLIFTTDTRG